MSTVERVENLVLGGGEAGKYIAWELAKRGRPVMVVERGLVGGSCPNIACLPSKNVIQSARVADLVSRASAYGVPATRGTTSMEGVRQRKREMVAGMVGIHEQRFAIPGLDFVLGEGRFTAPKTVEIRLVDGGSGTVAAERVFLNVGTRPALPAIPGLVASQPLTHIEALELGHLPAHLLVLGGGYVGVEFAQAFRRFGSRVTVVQRGPRLLPREDDDVAEAVRGLFEQEGLELAFDAETYAVEGRSGDGVRLRLRGAGGERVLEGSDLLVATGRQPNTLELGLELADVAVDARGYITVDDQLKTSAENVWALGECAGSPHFTHAAFDDFRVVRDQLAGEARSTRGRLVPHCVFLDPELGRVGLDEREAERLGVEVRVVRLPMTSVLRARAIGETRGFMKALLDTTSDRILGFTMLGANAGEVLAVVQTAMLAGLPWPGLRDAIFTHPTMAEGLNVLFAKVPPLEAPARADAR